MEKLVDLLKIIAEKHLAQTVASIALAILGVAFLPNLLDMTNKVGKTLYGVLIFCLGFLLIQGAKQIYTIAKNKAAEKNKKRLSDERRKREADENEAKAIERLWDYVDSLGLQDRHYLSEFLKTDNQPIEVMGEAFVFGLLANRNIVACTDKKRKCAPSPDRKVEFDGHLVFPPPDASYISYHAPTKLYRLKDDFFKLLKYSYDKYGKISHFDTEEKDNGQTQNADSE
jgi:hypothetical protein